jgi:hypothetical protein
MRLNKLQKIYWGWYWTFYMFEEWLLLMRRSDGDDIPYTIEWEAREFFHNLCVDYPYVVETGY